MKRFILPIVCSSVFFSNAALAAPPPKSTILHCGCVVNATTGEAAMQFVQITVSSKARGHRNHVAGSTDTCFNAAGEPVEFVRTSSDCSVTGGPPLEASAVCAVDQVAGAVCGQPEAGLQ